MRLIDADALIKELNKRQAEPAYHHRGEDWYIGMISAEELVYEAPTIEPEQEIGQWIEDARQYYELLNEVGLGVDEYTPYFVDDIACSKCLAKFSVIDNETQFFKFCPNCGADMRGER